MWIVMFLSAVWAHSDGTHSLQRIHWWASDVMLNFSKSVLMKSNSSTSWMAWVWIHLQQIFIFGWTIPSAKTITVLMIPCLYVSNSAGSLTCPHPSFALLCFLKREGLVRSDQREAGVQDQLLPWWPRWFPGGCSGICFDPTLMKCSCFSEQYTDTHTQMNNYSQKHINHKANKKITPSHPQICLPHKHMQKHCINGHLKCNVNQHFRMSITWMFKSLVMWRSPCILQFLRIIIKIIKKS